MVLAPCNEAFEIRDLQFEIFFSCFIGNGEDHFAGRLMTSI
jgi:hypothetical protein